MRSASDQSAISLVLVGLLVISAGCGQGEYDSRMSGAAASIARRAASGPQELTKDHAPVRGTQGPAGLKVRFPTLFTTETKSLDASQPKAKLLQSDLPGFCYTMERILADDAGKNIPAYCYLYAVPSSEAVKVHTQLQSSAAGIGPANWSNNPPVKSPTGDIAVKVLKVAGDMDFEVNGANERLPGQLEIYSFNAGANEVIIGWRAANSAARKHGLFDAVRASMASAQLDAPAAAPAPAAPGAPVAPAAGS